MVELPAPVNPVPVQTPVPEGVAVAVVVRGSPTNKTGMSLSQMENVIPASTVGFGFTVTITVSLEIQLPRVANRMYVSFVNEIPRFDTFKVGARLFPRAGIF